MPKIKSRTENLKRNIIVGFIAQFGTLVLSFVGRKLFISYLSVEYLGINGLYTNILSVLSLAEFGLGSVVSYSLYKPVAENNESLTRALVNYFQKLYLIIAGVIGVFGISLIPFLKYIVKSDLSESELIIYYVLLLISTISTYFVAHRVALLAAHQENRTQKFIALITAFAQQIIHIGVLILYPNYVIYIASTVICTLISNYFLVRVTSKKYGILKIKDMHPISFDKQEIIRNVKSSGLYKLSIVLINSTDNILISVIVSITAVGLYSNYCVVIVALQAFISIVSSSLINGIGNLHTERNVGRIRSIFDLLVLGYHFVASYCMISMFFIFNDFITIWLGKDFLLETEVVFAIAVNFYLTNLTTPIWSFREATGQFHKSKYIMLLCAVVNIALSIFLGLSFGVFGILIATTLSKLLTMFWYEPRILFNHVFFAKQKSYWIQQIRYFTCSVICFVLCAFLSRMLSNRLIDIIIKCIAFLIICSIVYLLFNFKSKEFKQILHEYRTRQLRRLS